MDGNNRWSKKKKLNLFDSYLGGAHNLIKISDHIFNKYDTNYISAFALSKSNLKRSAHLISTLIKVLENFLDKDPNKFTYNFQIVFIGDKSFLKSYLKKKIINLEKEKSISIDESKNSQEEVQNSTDNSISSLESITKQKETEILKV